MIKLNRLWSVIKRTNPLFFLSLAIICGVICVFALRANNEHMIRLRNDVFTADQNNGDVEGALRKLQAYVTTHMNTNLSSGNNVYPPIQLQHTYERLVQAQTDQIAQQNSQLYNEAQHFCEQQNSTDFSGRNRVPCVIQYVQDHSTQKLPTIPVALYEFSFASPSWSPDMAGWSLVLTIVLTTLFLLSILVRLLQRFF